VGHEAAHHIEGHIPKQQQTAIAGATLAGMILSASGASEETIRQAQRFGAAVGGRVYAQDMELEADALGTRIAALAGYDPVRGAEYFARIPDPGQTFIGTHPPNAKRQQVVRQTAASL